MYKRQGGDEFDSSIIQYIKKKYGKSGYAKSHIPNPDFEKFLAEIEQYLQNRGLFERKSTEVDEFLRKEYELRSE